MKALRYGLIFLMLALFASCQWDYVIPYITYEETIQPYIDEYGEPKIVNETEWYEDGTLRKRSVYFEIDPPEPFYNKYNRLRYYTSMHVVVWQVPTLEDATTKWHYGWNVLSETKGAYQFLD